MLKKKRTGDTGDELQRLKELREEENVRTFLNGLGHLEGTAGHGDYDGYDVAFGYRPVTSFQDHPRKYYSFTQSDGTTNKTSASGRYQFLESTWDGLAKQTGVTDFSPESQDIAAIKLIENAGALSAVRSGKFAEAADKLGNIWASLPTADTGRTKQGKRSWDEFNAVMGGNYTPKTVANSGAKVPSSAAGMGGDVVAEQFYNYVSKKARKGAVAIPLSTGGMVEALFTPKTEEDRKFLAEVKLLPDHAQGNALRLKALMDAILEMMDPTAKSSEADEESFLVPDALLDSTVKVLNLL